MKKNMFVLTTLAMACAFVCGCNAPEEIYAGSYDSPSKNPDKEYVMEPIEGLRNPDRGFHVESTFLIKKTGSPQMYNPYNNPETEPSEVLKKRFAGYGNTGTDHLVLSQQYIYLTEWVNSELDDIAIAGIRKILDTFRDSGYQAIVRFAYSWDDAHSISSQVQLDMVRKHIKKMSDEGIFDDYKGTIPVIETGFFGNWGEWAGATVEQRKGLIETLVETLPECISITMRYPEKESLGLADWEYSYRIGYNNDFFTAGEHERAPYNDFVGDDYYLVKEEAEKYNFYVVGEIPYEGSGEWNLNAIISLPTVLKTLKAHRYSAFDIDQNYGVNIISWRKTPVSRNKLNAYGILYDDSYFFNDKGEEVSRSAFEFIRDHLGYRLNIQKESTVSYKSGTLTYDIKLTNTGFATIVNPKKVALVVLDESGKIVSELPVDADTRGWIPCKKNDVFPIVHSIKGSVSASLGSGKYRVGLRIFDENLDKFDISCSLNGVNSIVQTDDSKIINVFASL